MTEQNNTTLKLIDRAEVSRLLAPTEGLTFTDVKPGDNLRIRFHGSKDEPVVDLGGTQLRIHPNALFDAGQCVGLTKKYIGKCPPELLFNNMNYFYGEGLSNPIRAVVRGDMLMSMTQDRVRTEVLSNERILRAVENRLGTSNVLGFHQVNSDLELTRIGVVTNKTFVPVDSEPTDVLHGGILIQNSILGKDVVELSPYIFRQWCSNGAVSSESLGKYSRKKHNGGLEPWVEEIIGNADTQLDREFERIRHLTNINVLGHIPEVLEGIRKDHHISSKIIEEVQAQATSSNAKTMYDLWNCITRVATHSQISTLASIRLSQIAGEVSKEHELCGQCHRIL